MTEEQRAGMKDFVDCSAINSAIYVRNYCKYHDCESCIFYGQIYSGDKGCKISMENPFGRTVPPEDWEV